MQRTRLNTLLGNTGTRFNQALVNPWRRISLGLISLLFGLFVGQAVSTTAGQTAVWDITSAALLVIFTESTSRFVYGRIFPKNTPLTILNLFKIGVVYSLFLEAFKLGS